MIKLFYLLNCYYHMTDESMLESNNLSQDIRSNILDIKYDVITKISGEEN